jgi:integration host factor subunit alpha
VPRDTRYWKSSCYQIISKDELSINKEPSTMTLTKIQIVESIHNETGLPKNKSTEIVESLLEIIKKALASGEDVMISNFGRFCVKEKAERKGRNPATGDNLMLEPRKVVTFRCSGKLRDRIDR